ncbi:MAG: hypothetical protein KDB00_05860 [Planctomycetales bacterium]|nr:hypothetical protein [Planctomycetales bacterium]
MTLLGRHDDLLPPGSALVDLDIHSVIEWLPESIARELLVIPIAKIDDTLHVVMSDANDFVKQDRLRFMLNCAVRAYQRSESEIKSAIIHFYGHGEGESADSLLMDFTETETVERLVAEISELEIGVDSHGLARRANVPIPQKKKSLGRFGGLPDRHIYDLQRSRGMLHYIVEEGEQVLVRHGDGTSKIVAGPAKIWRGFKSIQPMAQYVAYPGQYIKVMNRDGSQQHVRGPAKRWLDPRIHEQMLVEDGMTLATNEAVVVYGKNTASRGESDIGEVGDENGDGISRRVFYGPGIFIAEPGEWLHQFSWHASHGGSRGIEKKPHGRKFETLWLMPDQMYHDVRDVRTADDAVLTIRLMIFFELNDVEKMLNTTHDPIGDFVNAATSDVVEFTGKRTFEEFKGETEMLNATTTYTQLLHRASQCGYQINNVVYRGYGAPESLQKMHDDAIQSRTKLQLEQETERQAQDLEDYKLQCQMERATKRREEQTNEIEHEIDLKRRQANSKRLSEAEDARSKRELQRLQSTLSTEIESERLSLQREHLEGLRSMGVDLTEYLTQGKADQVIEMRGTDSRPHIHLEKKALAPK